MADKQLTIIEAWEKSVLTDYLNYMDAKGVTASGNSRRDSKVVMRADGGAVEVPAHHYWLWNGRSPNKDQSDEGLAHFSRWAGHFIFKDWVKQKGSSWNPYAVAWSVGKYGYTKKLTVSDVITDKKKSELLTQLGNMYITEIKTQINGTWQQ